MHLIGHFRIYCNMMHRNMNIRFI